jgi:hypothetical protein
VATAQLTGSGWVIFGASLVAAAIGLVRTLISPSDQRVAGWASRHEFALTDTNRTVVARYLRTTRSLQIAGATIGWSATPLYIGLLGRPFPLGDSWVVLALAGYLLGTVCAEALFLAQRRPSGPMRAAMLVPRTQADYIPAAAIWAIRALPAVTVALAVAYAVVPKDPQRAADPGFPSLAVAAVLAIAFAVAIDWLLRTIVARSQPATASDVLAADDAIRSSSMHALSAAGVAVLLLSAGWGLFSVGTVTSITLLSQVLPWCAVVCDVIALMAWVGLGHLTAWRVQHGASAAGGR